jgi:hypothetical protein
MKGFLLVQWMDRVRGVVIVDFRLTGLPLPFPACLSACLFLCFIGCYCLVLRLHTSPYWCTLESISCSFWFGSSLVFAWRLGLAHGLLVSSRSRAFLLGARHSWLVGCLAPIRLGQGLATLSLLVGGYYYE